MALVEFDGDDYGDGDGDGDGYGDDGDGDGDDYGDDYGYEIRKGTQTGHWLHGDADLCTLG